MPLIMTDPKPISATGGLTATALSNPVAVGVACILVVLFGIISLTRLPIQLTPDVERPVIAITTGWRAAAPNEVESELIEPQEDVLRGMPGVVKMTSTAGRGSASITLEFAVGTDMGKSLIDVINRLNQVQRYPVDVTEPFIRVGGDEFGNTIAWFALLADPDNPQPISTYQDFVDDTVLPRLERVSGISSANAFGGRQNEIRITFDAYLAASLGLDLTRIAQQLGSNSDVSAGNQEVGRRLYTIRYAGKYDIQSLGDLILEWRDNRPIRLRDIAEIDLMLRDRSGVISQNGGPSIALNVIPESGVNVLEVMNNVRAVVEELNQTVIRDQGLTLTQVYDETDYIYSSVGMVRNNLILGIMLAVIILWWFLRRVVATMIVALAIPLCLCIAFLILDLAGRTLNIISLAGLAFATGMVLDAAIVVLENIFRQREQGRAPMESSLRGTSQVWGALLASTATTVAIFMPVIFLEDEAGQLFGDLAVTISVAVLASLLVAITVIPTAAMRWLGNKPLIDNHQHWWQNTTTVVMKATGSSGGRWMWILGLILLPLALVWFLRPAAEYLPTGKQNFFFGFLQTAPGLGVDTAERELTQVLDQRFMTYLDEDASPRMNNYFLGFFGTGGFFGGSATDPADVDPLLEEINGKVLPGFPDTFGFASRAPIFGGSQGGRVIELDIQSREYENILGAAGAAFGMVSQALPGAQIRPIPGLQLAEPELRLTPDDRAIAEAGWTRNNLALMIRAMGDGAFVGEYFDGDRRLDVIMRSEEWQTPEELMALPMSTANGGLYQLGELVTMERTAGPSQIRRIDRRRTITLQITPPESVPLEAAIETLKQDVSPALQAMLPEDATLSYRGTAEALDQVLTSLAGTFALAIVILYLLISALFRSYKDSLLVVLTLPMATVGGVLFLRLLDVILLKTTGVGQSMDLLTMIGFVILLGLVVNNAILLVYRARDAEREGMNRADAVRSAMRLRLRPILMSTMTSLFGMLPLMLVPGAGTELYRGLAAVIVGGMLVSTLFTLILLPSLLRLGERPHEAV